MNIYLLILGIIIIIGLFVRAFLEMQRVWRVKHIDATEQIWALPCIAAGSFLLGISVFTTSHDSTVALILGICLVFAGILLDMTK